MKGGKSMKIGYMRVSTSGQNLDPFTYFDKDSGLDENEMGG
jgi:DNA invertase Pin-like site-specific DNA recombinase